MEGMKLDPSIIQHWPVSYVDRLFPEIKGTPYYLFHRKHQPSENVDYSCSNPESIDETEEALDLTGSPLKYSFGESHFLDSIAVIKRYWSKEEEKYEPLPRLTASSFLNQYLDHLENESKPIFVLCDGKDERRSILLGSVVSEQWFTTIEVKSLGLENANSLRKLSSVLLQEHLKLSDLQEYNVSVSVLNTFDLYGTREEMFDWNETPKSTFEGCLSLEVFSDKLFLDHPTLSSKMEIVAQIVTGAETSALNDLWNQLKLLRNYMSTMKAYDQKIDSKCNSAQLEFLDSFTTPYNEKFSKIMEELRMLLNGYDSYINFDTMDQDKTGLFYEEIEDNDTKLEQYIKNISLRQNQDFTDRIWTILIKTTDYTQLVKCILAVFENIKNYRPAVELNYNNPTKFAKDLAALQSEILIPQLSGSLPLEYLIDIGIEKLSRDYAYILIKAGFESQSVIKKLGSSTSSDCNIESWQKRLITMIQIHVCLEFVLLVQNNLNWTMENLRGLFSCALEEFVFDESPIQDYSVLDENLIYSLNAPAPVLMFNDLNTEMPVTRRVSLSSETNLMRLTTARYYSRLPIFPVSTFLFDDSMAADATYHVLSVISTSLRK